MQELAATAPVKPAGAACFRCPGQHRKLVASEPAASPRPRLAIVGEAPGHNELRDGRPFVGRSGHMLERGLRTLGLRRADVHWTNAVLCDVPPAHLKEARKCCAPRLRDELAAVGARVVVPVGAHALTSTLALPQKAKILEWRGSITRRSDGAAAAYVAPTVHPAFVMRAPQWGPVLEADFERVGRLLDAEWLPPEEQPGRHIVIAKHVHQLERLLPLLSGDVGIDVETVGLGPTSTALVCLAISDERLSVVIPYANAQDGSGRYWRKAWRRARAAINACLATRTAVTHNGYAFDHIVLRRYGIRLHAVDDTLCMAHAAHSHLKKALSFVVQLYCDVPPWKTFDHAQSLHELHVYNGRDSMYTAGVLPRLRQAMRDAGQEHIYELDKVTGALCREMQITGFRLDRARAEAMAARLETREKDIEARCADVIGRTINLLSPIQLREAFFGANGLGAYVCYVNEASGQPSLGVDVMRAYAASPNEKLAQFALDVLAYRRCRKVRITNLVNPLKALDANSRIHATWMNYGAVSGRFSSQGPNLMNLPTSANDPTITHDCGDARCGIPSGGKCKCACDRCAGVRSIYCARPGWTLVAFDRKQLEMRIAAYASQDPVMIAACESSDLHAANAEAIFGDAFRNGTDADRFQFRQLAKSAGFAVCYMAQAPTVYERIVAMGVRVTLRQVEGMLKKMRMKFRAYYMWQASEFEEICETGYVYERVTGRRRWLGSMRQVEGGPSQTEAANFPIQGGAAGLMNLQLPALTAAVAAAKLPAKLLAQVHDSGTFEVRNEAIADFKALANEVLDQAIELGGAMRVFPSDYKEGERWA